MKLPLDTCVWSDACQELETAGHDVVWTSTWPSDPGNEEILAYAHHEGRILVTLDRDSGELAVVRRIPHSRIVSTSGFCDSVLQGSADVVRVPG